MRWRQTPSANAALAFGAVLLMMNGAAGRERTEVKNAQTGNVASLTVGSLTLQRCHTPARWCGSITRPIDPAGAVAGTVAVYFEFYAHSASGKSRGMLVATEGGPGYPATESRDEYLALFRPLLAQRDLVIMDNRGTGRSGAVDCPTLQTAPA